MTHAQRPRQAAPAELGGRATAKATVSWLATGGRWSVQTDTPTRVVAELAGRFGGEIPELMVTPPSLEDIDLSMIGHAQGEARARPVTGRVITIPSRISRLDQLVAD